MKNQKQLFILALCTFSGSAYSMSSEKPEIILYTEQKIINKNAEKLVTENITHPSMLLTKHTASTKIPKLHEQETRTSRPLQPCRTCCATHARCCQAVCCNCESPIAGIIVSIVAYITCIKQCCGARAAQE